MTTLESDDVPTPAAALARMINGYWLTQMLYVAARLGVADALAEAPRTAEELAERTGSHARSLYRLLRTLSGLGIFAQSEDGRFALTETSSLLRSDVAGSLHGLALYSGDPRQYRYRVWGELHETVRTGQPAFAKLVGMKPFAYLQTHPDLARDFDRAMDSYSTECSAAILAKYDFGRYRYIVDVGGGGGRMLAEILLRHATLRGAVLDLPEVVARAKERFQREGLSERADGVAGDFFEHVPAGADLYLLKCVVHDWEDERAAVILQSCRRAMSKDATLLLAETVIRPGAGASLGSLMDMNMMVVHGGLERTQAEFAALLRRADLELSRVIFTGTGVDLVEARPI